MIIIRLLVNARLSLLCVTVKLVDIVLLAEDA